MTKNTTLTNFSKLEGSLVADTTFCDKPAESTHHDVIIIGAGVCGIYQLYRLLELDMNLTVLETGSGR